MASVWFLSAALLLPILAAGHVSTQESADFPGCEVTATSASCAWNYERGPTQAYSPLDVQERFDVPVFAENLVIVRARYTAPAVAPSYDPVWSVALLETTDEGSNDIAGGEMQQANGRHDITKLGGVHTWHILFTPVANATYSLAISAPPSGQLSVEYEVELPPVGEPAERPAATKDEPHLLGSGGNAQPGAVDLVAAWMNDPRLGDGSFEVRLAVANISDTGYAPTVTDPEARRVMWMVDFDLGGKRYHVVWRSASGPSLPERCDLSIWLDDRQSQRSTIGVPRCYRDEANSTFVAEVPESALGNPSVGVAFTRMIAESAVYRDQFDKLMGELQGSNNPGAVDVLDQQRFGFALGGPVVTDVLNGCRFCVEPAAWYREPLAADNLPNTLQVAGAFAASIVFLVGLAVVARRRRQLRSMLDHVAEVAARHDHDARAGLLAMGDLQTHYAERMRSGHLHETQYQLVAQRIAFVASQLALRRDLGLDDGVPGDTRASVARR